MVRPTTSTTKASGSGSQRRTYELPKGRNGSILDDKVRSLVGGDINMSVPWYLITSYLYYRKDKTVISDDTFDWLCKTMLDRWDSISHRHKDIIDLGSLRAGTGYSIPERNYPPICRSAAMRLVEMRSRCRGPLTAARLGKP
jgi:hypothetical protein